MPFTSLDLAAIDKAIASGELRVRFADREVLYRSVDELLKARDVIKDGIASSGGSSTLTRATFASFSKD
jgi:hypothetical protein